MGHYTDQIRDNLRDIAATYDSEYDSEYVSGADSAYASDPGDVAFTDALMHAAESFRTFDQALDLFLRDHGFNGDLSDIDAKGAFIRQKYHEAGIPVLKQPEFWFSRHRRIEMENVIRLAFAFHLGLPEVDDFCRRVSLTRGLDIHDPVEAIAYFCLRKGLSYKEYDTIQNQIKPLPAFGKIPESVNIDLTRDIKADIDRIGTCVRLVEYLQQHIDDFSYNKVRAYDHIRRMWDEIAAPGGLAAREREHAPENDVSGNGVSGNGVTGNKKSDWEVLLQILGYSKGDRLLKTNRSLLPVLKDNRLLHCLAADSFPSRQGIGHILRREHVSDEEARKLLILLFFYRFWMRKELAYNKNQEHYLLYQAIGQDPEEFLAEMNALLIDCGYQELYYGNPYDWIFYFALEDNYPLDMFRDFMDFLRREMDQEIGSAVDHCYNR